MYDVVRIMPADPSKPMVLIVDGNARPAAEKPALTPTPSQSATAEEANVDNMPLRLWGILLIASAIALSLAAVVYYIARRR